MCYKIIVTIKIANTIISNQKGDPVLEFAYQGPSLKYFGNKRFIVITGDVNFKIFKNDKKEIPGKCYKTIEIDNGDIIDIISIIIYLFPNQGYKYGRKKRKPPRFISKWS